MHTSSEQQQAGAQAVAAHLIALASSTAALAAPYMVAAGWGNVSAAWQAAASSTYTGWYTAPSASELSDPDQKEHPNGSSGSLSMLLGGALEQASAALPGGVLNARVLVANSSLSRAVPPGMVERARRHVAAVQLRLLEGLPVDAVRRVQVGGAAVIIITVAVQWIMQDAAAVYLVLYITCKLLASCNR